MGSNHGRTAGNQRRPNAWDEDHTGAVCYILRNPKGAKYVGATTEMKRRLRQHNSTARGAKQTRGRGPWEVICYAHGFATLNQARRFEKALQRPSESFALRHVIPSYSVRGAVLLMRELVTAPEYHERIGVHFVRGAYNPSMPTARQAATYDRLQAIFCPTLAFTFSTTWQPM